MNPKLVSQVLIAPLFLWQLRSTWWIRNCIIVFINRYVFDMMNLWDIHLHRVNIKPSLVPFLSWWSQVFLVVKHILNTRLAFFRNSHPEVFCWKVFLKISQNSQETPTILDQTKNHFPQFMKYKMKTNPNKIILEICDTKGKTEF